MADAVRERGRVRAEAACGDEALVLFVRAPVPGQTKTRLARAIGPERAAEVYRRMAEAVFRMALEASADRRRLLVWAAPGERAHEVQRWLSAACRDDAAHFEIRAQPDADLGARLSAAFEDAFAAGAKRVVVVGSDCMELGVVECAQAFVALEDHDAVIGPALDGGYYLLGLRRHRPRIFEDIAWGSASVGAQTLSRLRAERATVALLRVLSDIDTGPDLERAAVAWPWLTAGLDSVLGTSFADSLGDHGNGEPAGGGIEPHEQRSRTAAGGRNVI